MRREVALEGARLDRCTQRWVIATGRRVDVLGAERWLDGPIGAPDAVSPAIVDFYETTSAWSVDVRSCGCTTACSGRRSADIVVVAGSA